MSKTDPGYRVIGLMSGTSLDGLDIAFCHLYEQDEKWLYRILCAETVPYSREWQHRLSMLHAVPAFEFAKTDVEYGHFIGKLVRRFIDTNGLRPDFIASHGHTIFHQPALRLTCQIGKGSAIAAETGLPVVSDFRSLDVALGGQGAPLVPVGDRLLFGGYDFCLNLSGFANISYEEKGQRVAYDICPLNIVLNLLSGYAGKSYDAGGEMASRGSVKQPLLVRLEDLAYYRNPPPKSLGREWVENEFLPVILPMHESVFTKEIQNLLNTCCEHMAIRIAAAVSGGPEKTAGIPGKSHIPEQSAMLVTGGGTFNHYLVDRIRSHCRTQIVIPDESTINYKEALVFAMLGVLRWRGEPNCLGSVTGAISDNPGGCIYLPGG